jgi:hypothetical protein
VQRLRHLRRRGGFFEAPGIGFMPDAGALKTGKIFAIPS